MPKIYDNKKCSDWNFLNAETEINRANLECEQKLKSLLRGAIPKYEEWINMYTCLSVCDIEQRDIQCQVDENKTTFHSQ